MFCTKCMQVKGDGQLIAGICNECKTREKNFNEQLNLHAQVMFLRNELKTAETEHKRFTDELMKDYWKQPPEVRKFLRQRILGNYTETED